MHEPHESEPRRIERMMKGGEGERERKTSWGLNQISHKTTK